MLIYETEYKSEIFSRYNFWQCHLQQSPNDCRANNKAQENELSPQQDRSMVHSADFYSENLIKTSIKCKKIIGIT